MVRNLTSSSASNRARTHTPGATNEALSITLDDGAAHYMGDAFIVMQRDLTARRHKMQSVYLTLRDLKALTARDGSLNVVLEEGLACHMGEGSFVIMQRDATARGAPFQNVALSANDTAAMLAAA